MSLRPQSHLSGGRTRINLLAPIIDPLRPHHRVSPSPHLISSSLNTSIGGDREGESGSGRHSWLLRRLWLSHAASNDHESISILFCPIIG